MKRIVVVEDDTTFRKLIVSEINKSNSYECIASFSKISDFVKELPNLFPDLFWLDISLPDGSSIDYIAKIKQLFPSSLCMICSMHDDDDKVFAALKAGAEGYLLKNSTLENMMEGIEELFQGGSPISPFIARKVINSMKSKIPNTELHTQLTTREHEILSSLARGFQYKEVADQLEVSLETVKKHVQNIYKKLHVQNRTEALNKFNSFL